MFLSAGSVKRKVILYQCADPNVAIVRDYMRKLKFVPYDIVVPVYPEKGDMPLVQGKGKGDIWFGKVLSVDFPNNSVTVYFSVNKGQDSFPNSFVGESISREARNTVSLDAIIGIADGQWISTNTWQKSNRL